MGSSPTESTRLSRPRPAESHSVEASYYYVDDTLDAAKEYPVALEQAEPGIRIELAGPQAFGRQMQTIRDWLRGQKSPSVGLILDWRLSEERPTAEVGLDTQRQNGSIVDYHWQPQLLRITYRRGRS